MENNNKKQKTITCLDCQNPIQLEDREYKVGDLIDCPTCGAVLEVVDVKENGDVVVNIVEQEK